MVLSLSTSILCTSLSLSLSITVISLFFFLSFSLSLSLSLLLEMCRYRRLISLGRFWEVSVGMNEFYVGICHSKCHTKTTMNTKGDWQDVLLVFSLYHSLCPTPQHTVSLYNIYVSRISLNGHEGKWLFLGHRGISWDIPRVVSQIPVSYPILVQYVIIHHVMFPSLEAYVRASLNCLHVRVTRPENFFSVKHFLFYKPVFFSPFLFIFRSPASQAVANPSKYHEA